MLLHLVGHAAGARAAGALRAIRVALSAQRGADALTVGADRADCDLAAHSIAFARTERPAIACDQRRAAGEPGVQRYARAMVGTRGSKRAHARSTVRERNQAQLRVVAAPAPLAGGARGAGARAIGHCRRTGRRLSGHVSLHRHVSQSARHDTGALLRYAVRPTSFTTSSPSRAMYLLPSRRDPGRISSPDT